MIGLAYGTPYWNRTGRGVGDASGDWQEGGSYIPPAPSDNQQFGSFPWDFGTGPSSSSSPSWLPTFQTLEQDAFGILRLFNPVPPGTVMQVGPNGSYISRAQAGQPTPTVSPIGGLSGTTILLGLGALLAAAAVFKGRG